MSNDKHEHQVIVEFMKQIERTDASDPAPMDLIRQWEAQLREYIRDDEKDQFPRLRAHILARSSSSWANK